jgi:hypothetical protein
LVGLFSLLAQKKKKKENISPFPSFPSPRKSHHHYYHLLTHQFPSFFLFLSCSFFIERIERKEERKKKHQKQHPNLSDQIQLKITTTSQLQFPPHSKVNELNQTKKQDQKQEIYIFFFLLRELSIERCYLQPNPLDIVCFICIG